MLFPDETTEVSQSAFLEDEEKFAGFELVFEKNEKSFLVGYDRLTSQPMYGWIRVVGQPVNA
jgi:hypothetical protein